ncbi:MAG: response regulator transcription factor [Cyanobacteria bacterium]|nr:response regulator transcription factor [Cyanobacteriota bacterium]
MTSNLDQTNPIKVLIVDDHPIIRIGIKRVFENDREISVVGEVDTAEGAVSAAANLKPDVILIDIDLSDGSGIDAVAKIRGTKNSAGIIMFTSLDSDDNLLRSLAAGANGYCLKDVEPKLLRLAISSVFSNAMWFDPQIAPRVSVQFSRAFVSDRIQEPEECEYDIKKDTGLSEREREVLELLACGLSNSDVAMRLRISVPTVKTHVRNILKRLGVSDRTQAAIKAVRMQIVRA